MKLIAFLSATALAGLGTFAIAFSLGRPATGGLYALAVIPLLLLGAVRDYAPRRPMWQPRPPGKCRPAAACVATETMKLAA
jgi:hypothetical protein